MLGNEDDIEKQLNKIETQNEEMDRLSEGMEEFLRVFGKEQKWDV